MKQFIFPILLAISLALISIFSGIKITSECDQLISELADDSKSSKFKEHWDSFAEYASFVTPYDLIRTAESDCHHYIALIESDADEADIESARDVMITSIHQIKRIHSLNWELIF